MKDYRQWVYHPEHGAKIIMHSGLSDEKEQGWKESPAEFDGFIDVIKAASGIPVEKDLTPENVNAIGECYKDLKEISNFQLNVDKERSKKKIIAFLMERSTDEDPVVIPEKAGIGLLRQMVKDL